MYYAGLLRCPSFKGVLINMVEGVTCPSVVLSS